MNAKDELNYNYIAKAIEFILENRTNHPSLDDIAKFVGLSPSHFQRLFTDWTGTSPKQFLQFATLEHAKQLLSKQNTLFDTTYEIGYSSTSRLHDLFVNIEAMTPAQYKNGGSNLSIQYSIHTTNFGKVIIASTALGICFTHFISDEDNALKLLHSEFPKATIEKHVTTAHQDLVKILNGNDLTEIKLHLKGTDFQLKVWSALLKIPFGEVTSYGEIADSIKDPKASRAVGTAIGKNPVAFLIPCHRVIRQTGGIGGYMWGETRKRAILAFEHSKAFVNG